jgi:hypothetical protein
MREGGEVGRPGWVSNPKVPRHSGWRRTPYTRATQGGAALSAAPPAVALHHLMPHHREWRGQKGLFV